MKYFSTRDESIKISAAEAIAKGLAADGGLFVPEYLPKVDKQDLAKLCTMDYRRRAAHIMAMFLEDFSAGELDSFVTAAYGDNFDSEAVAPLSFVDDETAFLELWHGPTCAFKDMALQMLPHLLTASLKKTGEDKTVCILVATSGDTGKAALEGFADVEGTKIFVFYPKDGVSDIQRLQMVTQTGNNVGVCSVVGNFDDAQTGVKKIFGDKTFAAALAEKGYFLSSANSINWGRLLPQIVYYFSAYCDFVNSGKLAMGRKLDFCVPTGNFGNILAGWYAKEMGLPVGRLICASNENNVLTDFIKTGEYNKNRPFHTTISPSMDILVSNNLERLLYAMAGSEKVRGYMSALSAEGCYKVDESVMDGIASDFACGCCDDEATKAKINELFAEKHYLMDTHTAVAYKVLCDYRGEKGEKNPAVVVSTASPYKFAVDVLDALGVTDSSEPLSALSEKTDTKIPAPLSGLDKRLVRFEDFTEKEGMRDTVEAFLS